MAKNSTSSTLQSKSTLQGLYQSQRNIPKLIEDKRLHDHSWEKCYIKSKLLLREYEKGSDSDSQNSIIKDKHEIDVENIFDRVDGRLPAAGKVLLLGGPGNGKTTMLHNICYRWGKNELWTDKFDWVFRVRLKIMLSETWANNYSAEDKEDLLSCLVHRCLTLQIAEHRRTNRSARIVISVSDVRQIMSQDKVLLLLDGYNEIEYLARDDDRFDVYDEIMNSVFEHKYVVMSSRPNALEDCDKYQFERIVEHKGLEFTGISHYVDSYFGKGEVAEQLKSFIERNTRVRGMCQTPINTVLICLIWEDDMKKMCSNIKDFNMGLLLREVIIWLGKRSLEKFDGKDSKNIGRNNVLRSNLLEYLRKVAYEAFIRQGNFVSSKIINDNLVDDIEITKVYEFGLLQPICEETDVINLDCQFIHPIFQEYLVAEYLKESLASNSYGKACTLIGEHRNEPKYLPTLKFLTGIVSNDEEKDDGVDLITRFWEAISCNVDGILELGVETKVILLMHVLEQSKIKGEVDKRIPNLDTIENLVDLAVEQDIVRWGEHIIESGYVSEKIKQQLNIVLNVDDLRDNFELRAALAIIASLINKTEIVDTTYLVGRVMTLIVADSNMQLQKLGLQILYQLLDRKICSSISKDDLKTIVQLMKFDYLNKYAENVFKKILDLIPDFTKCNEMLCSLKESIEGSNSGNKIMAINILQDVVKTAPINYVAEAAEISLQFLNSAFEDQAVSTNCQLAIVNILKVMRSVEPEPAINEANKFYSRLIGSLENSQFRHDLKLKAVDSILYLVRVMKPQLDDKPKVVFEKLITLIEENKDENYNFVWRISTTLRVIPLEEMEEAAKRAFSLLGDLMKHFLRNSNTNLRSMVASNLGTLAGCIPKDSAANSKKSALKMLILLLDIPDCSLSLAAVGSIVKLIEPTSSNEEVLKLINLMLGGMNEVNYLLFASLSHIPRLLQFFSQDECYDAMEHKVIKSTVMLIEKNIRDFYKSSAISNIEHFLQGMSLNKRLIIAEDEDLSLFESLFKIINNSKADEAKQQAIRCVSLLLQAMPPDRANDVADKALKSLFRVINEPNVSDSKMQAVDTLPEFIQFIKDPNIVNEVIELLLTVVDNPDANVTDLMCSFRVINKGHCRFLSSLDAAISSISKILKFVTLSEASRIAEQVLDKAINKKCTKGTETLISVAPLSKSVNLLRNIDVKRVAISGIHAKLTNVDELAAINYTQVINLLDILFLSRGQDSSAKLLYSAAQSKLTLIIHEIDDGGIKWMVEQFDNLPNVSEKRTFLTGLYHKVLRELNDKKQISSSSHEFIIKCIEYGLTTTIKRSKGPQQKYQLVFEDISYTIHSSNESDLYGIAEAALLQDNLLAKQYKSYNPLFKNTESGLKVAASDIDTRSIVSNDYKINWQYWQLSVMHLSDQNRREPSKVLALLERRDHFGYQVIHKIHVDNSGLLCNQSYVLHPNEVSSDIREKLFGDMIYICSSKEQTKPRYYCSIFDKVSIETGMTLLQQVKVHQLVEDKWDQFILYQFLTKYAGLDLLSNFEWTKYVATAIELKKEMLLGLIGERRNIARRESESVDCTIANSQRMKNIEQRFQNAMLTMKNEIITSTNIKDSDKIGMQNQVDGITQKLQKIVLDLEDHEEKVNVCIASMTKVVSDGKLTKVALADILEDVDRILSKIEFEDASCE